MKIRFLTAATLALGLVAALPATAQDDVYDGRFYLGPHIGFTTLDEDRGVDHGDAFFGISFGKFFTTNLSLDLEYSMQDARIDGAGFANDSENEIEYDNISLVGRYHFGAGDHRPFVSLGLGTQRWDTIADDGNEFLGRVGAGISSDISDHLSTRFEVSYMYADGGFGNDDDFSDFGIRGGLLYKFGAPPAAPAPAPAPAPEVDADSDNDGVPDSRDRCPNTPAGVEVDENGCPIDSDGDGVPNNRDKCPDTRPGAVVDLDGCEVEAVIDLPNVYFDFDESHLRPEGKDVLDDAAELLKNQERVVVEVAGHTDSIGTDAYNQDLSQRRADSVHAYLVSQGVSASRMQTKGYGESRPVATNETDEGRQQNRRVELVVLER